MSTAAPPLATNTRLPIAEARKIIDAGLIVPGPRTHPCVCGAGRHEHAGAQGTGACASTGCRRYRVDIAWDLAYRALDAQETSLGHSLREADRIEREKHRKDNPRGEGEWSIGASDAGTCPRKIQYRNAPPEGFEPAPEDQREARMGSIIHAEAVRRLAMLYPWRLFEQPVRVAGLDRDSKFDSYDPITGEVEDIKTAGDWRWDVLGEKGPEEEVWEQIALYALALEDQGHYVSTLKASYIKRCNGHDEVFTRPYDRAFAEAARDRLLGYATSLDLGIDLPKTGTGPTDDALCRRCFARNHCWNIPAAEQAGRSPESYTILGADPADDDIIWAISEKVEASRERLAAEKREAAAKNLMEGIEPGRYGEFEGYAQNGGGGDDHKAYAAKLAELFNLPDGMRPPIEAIPMPQKHRYTFIKWGRVRKATLDKERKARQAAERGEVA